MTETPPLCEAFVAMAEMAEALGIKPLNQHEGCWEFDIDERWKIAVNGHNKPMTCPTSAVPIEPFHCYVTFNGWPAGILNPCGGIIAAGEAANERTFIEAMKARATKGAEK